MIESKNIIIRFFVLVLCFTSFYAPKTYAQHDSPELLKWVENQGNKVDSMLNSAIRGHDQVEIFNKLMDAYLVFESVTLAGLYCTEVREAAQEGRNYCDLLNFRLGKDMNASVVRTIQARRSAENMKNAARNCLNQSKPSTSTISIEDVIKQDILIVELDLSDGLASSDFHIMAQKLEHAIRLLYDVRRLAFTLNNCSAVEGHTKEAISLCETALSARRWDEVTISVNAALEVVRKIPKETCR